ncbi:hypothetical protein O181_118500 [Austropuccinia psidii MF-1]|uniref:Uncharacterized protein n=1 Tax=Austropuccinia psidii MF-1 TaxID=1389203 RepID=A0A9Q3KGI5_9BASI|nr:hypothetical protein [Austropuccinia psidii MF-1]
MQQMTQIMANLQAASSSKSSRPPPFNTSSIKAPDCFDGTLPFKVRFFIQSCQLIFHDDQENFILRQEEISLCHFISQWQGCKINSSLSFQSHQSRPNLPPQ